MIPYDQERPLILGKSHLINLLIQHLHENNDHCGVGLTRMLFQDKSYIQQCQIAALCVHLQTTVIIFRCSHLYKGLKEDLPAIKRWLQVQELQTQFWAKFESEYLGYKNDIGRRIRSSSSFKGTWS